MNSYLFYAKFLEEISSNRTNIKSLILSKCQSRKFTPSQIKKTYSIVINSHKNLSSLKQILKNFLSAYPEVQISNSWLFLILLHEFFRSDSQNVKSLKGGGFLIRIIKKYQDFFKKELSDLKIPLFSKSLVKESVYVRMITGRIDLSRISKEINEKIGKKIEIKEDLEIPNLISLDYDIYSKAFCDRGPVSDRVDIVIQGKSSCYPACVLFKPFFKKKSLFNKKFDVIDACAAPGNKTLQLSEYLLDFPKSNLLVFEKNTQRFELLEERLRNYDIIFDRTTVVNGDFLSVDPFGLEYSNVKLLLLDPSCSGSGMRNHLFSDEKLDFEETGRKKLTFEEECERRFQELESKDMERVENLQGFQYRMLCHAMKFPKVMRICYSTCSLYRSENEAVVEEILANNKEFELANLRKTFKGLEKGFGKLGAKCLRANPFKDLTDGFFIALFKRKKDIIVEK